MSFSEIQQKISEGGEQVIVADTFLGSIAIREYIEDKGIELRDKPYTKRHANELMSRADFFDVIPTNEDAPIIYVNASSLDSLVENNCQKR